MLQVSRFLDVWIQDRELNITQTRLTTLELWVANQKERSRATSNATNKPRRIPKKKHIGGGHCDVEDGNASGNNPDVDGNDGGISGSEDDAVADYGGQQEPQPDKHGHEEESEHILQPREDTRR